MGRKWQIFLIYCFCLLSFGSSRPQVPDLPVVTEIQVSCSDGQDHYRFKYCKPEKVCRVLLLLRQQQCRGYAAVDPERLRGSRILLCLTLSDGSVRTYRQRAGQYLSRQEGRWHQTDPGQGQRLLLLLHAMPPDLVANGESSCYNIPKGRWIP